MKKFFTILLIIGISNVVASSSNLLQGETSAVAPKDIGDFDGGNFSSRDTFNVGEEATVKITVKGGGGRDRQYPDIVLVMDRTGSMGLTWSGRSGGRWTLKIESAKRVLKEFTDNADPQFDRIGLVTYAVLNNIIPKATLDSPLTTDFAAVKSEIDSMIADGTTSIGAGMQVANEHLITASRPGSPKYMVLATDGLQNTPPSPFDDGILDTTIQNNITVYTVGIGDDADGSLLQHIATQTGGKYYFAPNEQQLVEIYEQIKKEISFNWDVSIDDTLTDPYFSDLEITKVTDGGGVEKPHNLSISGRKISGDLGTFPAGEERIIYVKVRINKGSSGFGPWTTSVNDEDEQNKVYYKDADDNIVAEEDIGNKEITISVPCDRNPPTLTSGDQCSLSPTWTWLPTSDAQKYHIQVATDPDFSVLIYEDDNYSKDLTSYQFDASDPALLGSALYFRVFAYNSCNEWSPPSNTARAKVDMLDVSSNLNVAIDPPGPGTERVVTLTVDFKTASSGTVDFTLNVGGNSFEERDVPFTGTGSSMYLSQAFDGVTINIGDPISAKAIVNASNQPSGPSCGSSEANYSESVVVPDWMQVINGDVYSNYNDVVTTPGVSFYVYNTGSTAYDPLNDSFEPFFLVAYPNSNGGIIQARREIECFSCSDPAKINERDWNVSDPDGILAWPLELLGRAERSVAPGSCRDDLGDIKICRRDHLDIADYDTTNPDYGFVFSSDPKVVIIDNDLSIGDVKGMGEKIFGVFFVEGAITIDGIYDAPVFIQGSLFANRRDFSLGRSLTDNQKPAIVVEYDPKYILLPIPLLSSAEYSWREVKPL